MTTQALTIRIAADASGAISVISQTTAQVNQLGQAGNNATQGVASLSGGVQNLGRYSATSTSAIASLSGGVSGVSRSMQEAANSTANLNSQLAQTDRNAVLAANSMGSFKSLVAGLGIAGLAQDILKTNIAMEQLHARLEAVMGSANVAAQAFQNILQVAKETPQSVEEISKSFMMLKNFGIEPTMQVMQDLTNMTSRLGGQSDTLSGITLALGQSFAKGKLQAQDANQMIERGVPVYSLLSKELGKTSSEILNMMEKGELTRPVIEKLIHAMGNDSVGASTKMMATLGGKINMLGDAWHNFEVALLNDQSQSLLKRIVTGWTLIFDELAHQFNKPLDAKIADLDAKIKRRETSPFISGLASVQNAIGLGNTNAELQAQRDSLNAQKMQMAKDATAYASKIENDKKVQVQADTNAKAKELLKDKTIEFGTAQEKENLALKEAGDKYGELTASMKEQIHAKFFHKEITHANASAHKAESSAQREATQAAKEHQQLVDKFNGEDPFEKYAKSMAKLKSVQDKLKPEVFLLNAQKIAAEFEKSTVGIEKLTEAERERQRVFSQTARGKFEKSTDELRAQKPFMAENEYANKQDKIGVDYLHDSGQNKEAKTQIDLASEAAKKYEEQIKKTATANYELGSSSKMAFDGILGGVSAVAAAFTDFGGVMEKNATTFKGIQDTYDENMKRQGATEEQKAGYTKQFAKEKDAYNTASFQAEISGARSIAGATSKMFGEKSAGRKAFHAVEMGLSVIEMAMSLKKTAMNVMEGASAMFGSGWAGFAGVAAMVAVMAGFGFASSGGNSGKMPEYTKTTGTVLGDSEAQSHSIDNVIKKLDDIHASEFPELRKISDAMGSLGKAQNSMLVNLFRDGGIKLATAPTGQLNDNSGKMAGLGVGYAAYTGIVGGSAAAAAGGIAAGAAMGLMTFGASLLAAAAWYALSKVPIIGDILNGISSFIGNGLFGKVTKSVVGGGVRINEQSMGSVMDDSTLNGNVFTTIETKKSSWFKTTRKYSEVLSSLGDEFSNGLSKVVLSMGVAVQQFWNYLGKSPDLGLERLRSFVIKAADIKTFGLKDTEIQEALKNYTSMTFDKMIEHVFGAFVSQFQGLGETMAEAMARIYAEAEQTRKSLTNMGATLSGSGEDMIIFSQSLINAAGGVKNLIATLDNFTNKFTSKDVKQGLSLKEIQDFTSNASNQAILKTQGFDMSVPNRVIAAASNPNATEAEVKQLRNDVGAFGASLVTTADNLSKASNKFSSMEATQARKEVFDHDGGATKAQQGYVDLLQKSHTAWANLSYTTTTAQAKAMEGTDYAGAITTGGWGTLLNPVFQKNDAVEAKGLAKFQALGITASSDADYEAQQAAERAKSDPFSGLTIKAVSMADSLNTVLDNALNVVKVQVAAIGTAKTTGQNTESTRESEIANLGTEAEKVAKTAYYLATDLKKLTLDTTNSTAKVFDLTHTAAEVAQQNLLRGIEKLKDEALTTEAGNAALKTRIGLLKSEFNATQQKAYSDKQKSLAQELFAITASDSEKAASDLALKIKDITDNFVEVKDAAGNVLNPLQNLITLTTQIADAKKFKDTISAVNTFSDSLKKFKQTLITGDLSTLTPVQKYKASQDKLNADYKTIMGGEGNTTQSKNAYNNAVANIQSDAESYLAMSKKMYASGANYQADFAMVKGTIDSVIQAQDSIVTDAQKQLDALTTQTGLLSSIDASLKGISMPLAAESTAALDIQTVLQNFIPVSKTSSADKNNGISEEIILELKALREEVARLRAENAENTSSIIKSNFEANTQAADLVNEGIKQTVTKNAFAANNKVVLA